MSNSRFEEPSGLGAKGRHLWDLYTAHFDDDLASLDLAALEQACKYADLLDVLHQQVIDTPDSNNPMIRLGIATDKFLDFSHHLGLTYADRVKLKIELSAKEKAAMDAANKKKEEEALTGKKSETRGRPRRSTLDDLRPENLRAPAAAVEQV